MNNISKYDQNRIMAKCNIQIPDVSELRDQIINKAVWCYRDAPACKSYSPYVREHLVPQQKSNHHWNLKNQILSFYLICDSHLNCYIHEKNQNMIFIFACHSVPCKSKDSLSFSVVYHCSLNLFIVNFSSWQTHEYIHISNIANK